MASKKPKIDRRELILQGLAHMLENHPEQPVTIAALARASGVSAATIRRHFPERSQMFAGLILFVEEVLLSRINIILQEEKDTLERCHHIVQLVLLFAERNPGISRILNGDALSGEEDALRERISLLFERLLTQLKQVLRERGLREGRSFAANETVLASLLLAYIEGRISQFVRTKFLLKPSIGFELQWQVLRNQLLQS